MSFVSMMRSGELPEKPWKTGAVVRFLGSVLLCIFAGAAVGIVFNYFETDQKSSPYVFLPMTIGAFVAFIAAVVLLMRPWPLENPMSRMLGLAVCVYGGFALMWFANRLITGKTDLQNPIAAMLVAVLMFQGAAIVLAHFFLRQHQTNWADGFGLLNRPWRSLIIGVFVGLLTLGPAWWLQAISVSLSEKLALHPQEQQTVEILRQVGGWPSRVLMGVATIFIAPMGEEIIFRGILYPAIKRTSRRQLALWSTALLFGAIHANLASFVPLTLLAVVLVWLYEYTGNLLACFAVHGLFNAVNFMALYLQQK
jgi:membrane protease YdiL (CAAX protease family)